MGCFRMGCWTSIKSFHVKIILLDKQELIQEIQHKTTGQDLLDNIFKYLNLIETAYFGLRYQDNNNQTHWLDPNKKISRQIKGVSPITLYLGVKFYAADPCKLVEEITRYQFFLQVKLDILQGRLPVQQDLATELAALVLQSELGDYDGSRHSGGYVSEFRFVSNQTADLEIKIEEIHRKHVGLVPSEAENRYLEKVKWLDMYGVDLHPVIGEDNIEYFLGLTPSGIIVLKNRNKVGNYFWPRISKIYFKGKYFMLRVRDKNNDENTYGFETPSRQACKHLWKCCVEHHAFFRLVQVSPTFISTGMFGLGSKFRYSGRTEKEAVLDVSSTRRNPPSFTRIPSKRYSRRNSRSEDMKRNGTLENKDMSMSQQNIRRQPSNNNLAEMVRAHSTHSLPRTGSTAHQSLPPVLSHSPVELRMEGQHGDNMDMSLQSLQWLETRGLFGSRAVSRQGSAAEHREHREHRAHPGDSSQGNTDIRENTKKRSSSRRGGSDEESEVSVASFASRRGRNDSGSESESQRSARKNHRGRRKRQGSYKLIETDEQWREVQRQQVQGRKSGIAEATVRKSGYTNSGAETESEVVTSLRRNKRRQRSRSRSPSEAKARLPSDLVKHFSLRLVDPDPEHQQDIPYTSVETQKPVKVRYPGGSGRRSQLQGSARRKLNVEERRTETQSEGGMAHGGSWTPAAMEAMGHSAQVSMIEVGPTTSSPAYNKFSSDISSSTVPRIPSITNASSPHHHIPTPPSPHPSINAAPSPHHSLPTSTYHIPSPYHTSTHHSNAPSSHHPITPDPSIHNPITTSQSASHRSLPTMVSTPLSLPSHLIPPSPRPHPSYQNSPKLNYKTIINNPQMTNGHQHIPSSPHIPTSHHNSSHIPSNNSPLHMNGYSSSSAGQIPSSLHHTNVPVPPSPHHSSGHIPTSSHHSTGHFASSPHHSTGHIPQSPHHSTGHIPPSPHHSNGHIPPSPHHSNGHIPTSSHHNQGPTIQNGYSGASSMPTYHPVYSHSGNSQNQQNLSRNWPPTAQITPRGGQPQRPGAKYEPSGDEMSTEL